MGTSASTRYTLPLSVRQELAAYESAIAAGCSSDEAREFAHDLYGFEGPAAEFALARRLESAADAAWAAYVLGLDAA